MNAWLEKEGKEMWNDEKKLQTLSQCPNRARKRKGKKRQNQEKDKRKHKSKDSATVLSVLTMRNCMERNQSKRAGMRKGRLGRSSDGV